MEQVEKRINVLKAISVMDDWFSLGKPYSWAKEPLSIKAELVNAAYSDGSISYVEARKILMSANSGKMVTTAQAGFGYITDNWKKIYDK